MAIITGRRVFWAIPVGAVAAGLVFAFWPRPIDVDLATVTRGPLVTTVAQEGQTRIRDTFVVSAPVHGRALRIEIEEGDEVVANETVVAEIEPMDPEFLDVRSEATARADADAARAALKLAQAELTQAQAELDFAKTEVERMRELWTNETVSLRVVQEAERTFRIRTAALATAAAAVEMRENLLRAAEVRLVPPGETSQRLGNCPCIPIRAPIDGQVLRVLHESEGVVAPGQPLLEVGNPEDLEIVADFRSSDAVRIEPGQRAIIDNWGGDRALSGTVRRIDPFGYTKVSALGIEEQRVSVVIDISDPPAVWTRLGHGFEVEVDIVLWEASDVPKVPATALFRNGEVWQVFQVVDGRARTATVEVGERTDREARILSGLDDGDEIVRFPDDRIEDGVRLQQR
ncbi:efflux RND transporter periplasmic adaptor subunit [Boseongicola aestuarii]|uniref:Putative efflux system component YknX n=1 Tax=Boseongicola aestuarii TaxID=1470561 RepID=A0A238IVK3_9RHOB|nr:HlyD family efflux transporter periplasmic adaptor subunit [Boseongicola aestuarii]SMX21915.1 Putative efflux system component YknX [Boseongicola aestuarii]